jgi:hypothetical protein
MRLTALFALMLTATPALADCVTKDDLAKGVSFKRQDGRLGVVKSEGKSLAINYAANSQTAWQDERNSLMGIYDTTWAWTPTDEYYVGGGPGGGYSFKFSGKPPVPEAGSSWKSTISVTETQDNGTENGPEEFTYKLKVTYSYQDTKEAKLSGCTYTIQPVEATFTGKNTHLTRRWIYFPDLGFGLETRVTDHQGGDDRKLGLTALTPM